MAESTDGNAVHAVRVLREISLLLTQNQNPISNTSSSSVSSPSNSSPSNSSPSNSQPSGIIDPGPSTSLPPAQLAARNVRISQNFQRLFSPYARASPVPSFASSSCTSIPNRSGIRGKRRSFYTPKETWTHEFVCLAKREQQRVPSRSEKFVLQNAGLGRKKICFHSQADWNSVKLKLEETFPKLKNSGSFQVLRSGSDLNKLVLLIPPPSGYSVPYLRDVSGLGQALAYVRPLQCDLVMEECTSTITQQVKFITKCYLKIFLMKANSQHFTCGSIIGSRIT